MSDFFGWSAAILPGAVAAYSAYRGRKQTMAAAIVIMVIAFTAQYYRTKAMAELTINRWEPLSTSEQLKLKGEFERMPTPSATFQVLCPLAGCADLAESILGIFPLRNWKVAAGTAYWDGIPNGLELWGYDPRETAEVAEAISRATSGRIQPTTHSISEGGRDQLNLLIGRKPR